MKTLIQRAIASVRVPGTECVIERTNGPRTLDEMMRHIQRTYGVEVELDNGWMGQRRACVTFGAFHDLRVQVWGEGDSYDRAVEQLIGKLVALTDGGAT